MWLLGCFYMVAWVFSLFAQVVLFGASSAGLVLRSLCSWLVQD